MMKLLKTLFLLSLVYFSYQSYKIYKVKQLISQYTKNLPYSTLSNQADSYVKLYSKKSNTISQNWAKPDDLKLQLGKGSNLNKNSKRSPASIRDHYTSHYNSNSKAKPKKKTRSILGPKFPLEDLQFKNSIDPDWEAKLSQSLLKFQDSETKLHVQSISSFIKVDSKKNAYFVEEVLVSYIRPNGLDTSFKALVDSDSGTIMRTWSKTISENIYSDYAFGKKLKLKVKTQ